MENKKATTLAQRFGFADPELTTPKHDELMCLLDVGSESYFKKFVSAPKRPRVLVGAGDPPRPTDWIEQYPISIAEVRVRLTWEVPVMNGNYMIGFADMFITVTALFVNGLTFAQGNKWMAQSDEVSQSVWVEVKPSIPSAGECIRQIRMYQQYCPGSWYIFSPDERFRSVIEGQGIKFITPGDISNP